MRFEMRGSAYMERQGLLITLKYKGFFDGTHYA
jgi:hypothetical protein